MKIAVRRVDGDGDGGLAAHAEKHLRRVLESYCGAIDLVRVRIDAPAGVAVPVASRCRLTVRLSSAGSVEAEASDGGEILAVHRAADKVRFLLDQRLSPRENAVR